MRALTPAPLAQHGRSLRLPRFAFRTSRPQPHNAPERRFHSHLRASGRAILDPGFATNEQARRHIMPKRVRHPAGCPFASGCFPPRLTATQLPSATYDVTSHGKDSHLCRQSVLADALIPAKAGIQGRPAPGSRRPPDRGGGRPGPPLPAFAGTSSAGVTRRTGGDGDGRRPRTSLPEGLSARNGRGAGNRIGFGARVDSGSERAAGDPRNKSGGVRGLSGSRGRGRGAAPRRRRPPARRPRRGRRGGGSCRGGGRR